MRVIVPKELEMASEQHMATHFSSRGQSFRYPDDLVAEHTMEIYLNDTPAYEVVCSPTDLPELVLGRLLSNGVIQSTDEVELLYLCENGLRAKVYLPKWEPATEHPGVEQVSTCCTGNRTIADLFRNQTPPRHLRPIAYEQRWIFRLAEAMSAGLPLYQATHAVHSCFVLHRGHIFCACEDIGRHNALDKVLGWALMQGIPLEECIVYTSGRIPVDMVMKVIRAGVPVLASKAMPTRESVLLAEEFGLSLIGAARKDSMVVF